MRIGVADWLVWYPMASCNTFAKSRNSIIFEPSKIAPSGEVFSIAWNSHQSRPVYAYNPSTFEFAVAGIMWLLREIEKSEEFYSFELLSESSDSLLSCLKSVFEESCEVSPDIRSESLPITCDTYIASITNSVFYLGGSDAE